jgi:hypothetical protein
VIRKDDFNSVECFVVSYSSAVLDGASHRRSDEPNSVDDSNVDPIVIIISTIVIIIVIIIIIVIVGAQRAAV